VRLILSRWLRRLAVPTGVACTLVAGVPAQASAASRCDRGDRSPHRLSVTALHASTLCLINGERAAHGLRTLRLDSRLGEAARRHSDDMVAHRYFAHDSRSGAGFSTRIAATGWMNGRRRWAVGENLAWGTGSGATARAIVATWMASRGHRQNILKARFRVIGIGIDRGVPFTGAPGVTYTTDFGS
jgi:uncharacterized protein YkwD